MVGVERYTNMKVRYLPQFDIMVRYGFGRAGGFFIKQWFTE